MAVCASSALSGTIRRGTSEFFLNRSNKLARFVGKTKGVDKVIKTAKATSDFSATLLEIAGKTGVTSRTLRNISTTAGTARSIIGLSNIFTGVIPSTIASAKKCASSCSRLIKGQTEQSLVSQEDKIRKYNEIYTSKGDHALQMVQSGCAVVGGLTYTATFGGIRPTLLANKLSDKSFLNNQTKANLNKTVDVLMAANHVAEIVGATCSLAYENAAYKRGVRSWIDMDESASSVEHRASLSCDMKKKHTNRVKQLVLKLVEQMCEIFGDILKLVPLPIASSTRAICSAAAAVASSTIGLYSFWTST